MEAFGYKNLGVEGYEADDVIASIVERARTSEPKIPVMVVTGDRDAYQLVDDGVIKIMTTSRGITDTRVYDREGVIDRYGIPPELIPDFIGLKGDTSDNIPGVPGIGDKTAAELLQRFGTLEDVLGHIDDISGAKRKQNLTEHADVARISKQLATAKRDIDTRARPNRSRGRRARPLPNCAIRSASSSCANRCAGWRRRSARPTPRRRRPKPNRRSPPGCAPTPRSRTWQRLPDKAGWRLRSGRRRLRPKSSCSPRTGGGASACYVDGSSEVPGRRCGFFPRSVVEALGRRPVIAHDAKSLGVVPGELSPTTPRSRAYLLEPARRAYPFRELHRGTGPRHRPGGRGGLRRPAASGALAYLAA